jgi:hypothetical protein
MSDNGRWVGLTTWKECLGAEHCGSSRDINLRRCQVVSATVLITFAQDVSTCRRSVFDAAQSRSLEISCRDLGKPWDSIG